MNLNEMAQLNPPAIVQEENQEARREAQAWDQKAQDGEKNRCRSMLSYSEALYNLEKDEGYKLLGDYASIYAYVYDKFGRSKASTTQTISVYKKYVIELGCTIEQLIEVGIAKLSQMAAHVDEDNIDDTLEEMKTLSQKEITEKIKGADGLAPNEEHVEPEEGDKEPQKKITFKGPISMIESVQCAVGLAKETLANASIYYGSGKDVPDLAGLDLMAAVFLSGADLEGKPYSTLQTSLEALERVYNIKISYQDAEESE